MCSEKLKMCNKVYVRLYQLRIPSHCIPQKCQGEGELAITRESQGLKNTFSSLKNVYWKVCSYTKTSASPSAIYKNNIKMEWQTLLGKNEAENAVIPPNRPPLSLEGRTSPWGCLQMGGELTQLPGRGVHGVLWSPSPHRAAPSLPCCLWG